jgi:hypothetical protein
MRVSDPQYPIFVPTKGRHKTPLTIRALEAIGVPFHPAVQPQEYDEYARVVRKPASIIVLPSDVKGLVPTRNWIWDYAQHELKTPYFWTFDDNIKSFYRFHNNMRYRMNSGVFLRVIEDFAGRYTNMIISGMNYAMFCPRKFKFPPYILNTRVYSNMLIQANAPYRNRGVYNDDTDLCLQILKDGHCVIQFNSFLADKMATMKLKGGNTDIYQGDGRLKMAQELQARHPDVVKITRKWGRWQHVVDYRPFRNNKLILRPGVVIPDEPNNYGMVLMKNGKPIQSPHLDTEAGAEGEASEGATE